MTNDESAADLLLQESAAAEQALIEAESRAEHDLLVAERRLRRALERLEQAQQRVERRRREFEQARALLDQRQLERASGPATRRVTVARPALPRPARDDSRIRRARKTNDEPLPADSDSSKSSESDG